MKEKPGVSTDLEERAEDGENDDCEDGDHDAADSLSVIERVEE